MLASGKRVAFASSSAIHDAFVPNSEHFVRGCDLILSLVSLSSVFSWRLRLSLGLIKTQKKANRKSKGETRPGGLKLISFLCHAPKISAGGPLFRNDTARRVVNYSKLVVAPGRSSPGSSSTSAFIDAGRAVMLLSPRRIGT